MVRDYKKQILIAKKLSQRTSDRSGVPFEDLFSEALLRLPQIQDNFIEELGFGFEAYLKSSLNGYLKNYVRDHSFSVKIPRKVSDIYMKTKNYSTFSIASAHTGIPIETIENAHHAIKTHRSYNTQEVLDWTTEIHTLSSTNSFVTAWQILDEADVDTELLLDYFVYGKTDKQLCLDYGADYYETIEKHTETVREVCLSQGYQT